MPYHGIIDFGSNTIRLCIYDIKQKKRSEIRSKNRFDWKNYSITLCLNYKVMAGLSSFIQDGVMSKKGIQKAIKTIEEHHTRANYFGCQNISIFATAVLRNCINSFEVKTSIEQATNLTIDILSDEQEAHLGFIGTNIDSILDEGVLVDIGGGSTELTVIHQNKDESNISIPQGSLSSYVRYVSAITPTLEEIKLIQKRFTFFLKELPKNLYHSPNLFGIGGTVRSVEKVYGDIFNNGNRCSTIQVEHLKRILDSYSKSPNSFAHAALKTIPDRIHTFIPGCVILYKLFSFCNSQNLYVAKHGLREGYLIERVLKIKN